MYPNHLQILIINEKLAKEDISQIVDFYLRIPATRTEFNILIGKDENILSTTTPIDDISATSILETMEINNKYLGVTDLITFNEFVNMNLDKKLEIILPSIEVINYNKESQTIENTENTKIVTIATQSGFSSEQSFYRNFHKCTGMKPLEWVKGQHLE